MSTPTALRLLRMLLSRALSASEATSDKPSLVGMTSSKLCTMREIAMSLVQFPHAFTGCANAAKKRQAQQKKKTRIACCRHATPLPPRNKYTWPRQCHCSCGVWSARRAVFQSRTPTPSTCAQSRPASAPRAAPTSAS
eukprot:1484578-Rhodomonas_salina.1